MQASSRALRDILWPLVFIAAASWITWNFPKFIISFGWAADALKVGWPAAGIVDWLAMTLLVVAFVFGLRTVEASSIEAPLEAWFDRVSMFLGRVTMLLIVLLVSVMFYEVVLRYVFERPTLWANELSLWIAGFIFLFAGLYAMQQRSHIRIYLLYDAMPRWLQKASDVVSVALIWVFTVTMIWGGLGEAQAKLLRWETFGTAFDPPIPATLKPMVLLVITLVAMQALSNLIADWHKAPEHHAPVDEAEIEELVHEMQDRVRGADIVPEGDVRGNSGGGNGGRG